MKTFKRNKHNKNRNKSSKTRGGGWFRTTIKQHETYEEKLEKWFINEGKNLNKIFIKILTKMEHNAMCKINKKKYVFTTCEKPLAKNKQDAENSCFKVLDKINQEIDKNHEFDSLKYIELFIDNSDVNSSNDNFNKYVS